MKFHYMAHDSQSKSMKKLWPGKDERMKLTGPVTFIQTFFSLGFNSLFKVAELSFGSFWV